MNKIYLLLFLSLILSVPASGTKIKPTDLKVLVSQADYIVIGKVKKVDMVDANGNEIVDPNVYTGRKSLNTIRYHVVIDQKHVIKGNNKKIPYNLILPDWRIWFKRLGDTKKYREGKTFIFLLSSPDFRPKPPAEFIRDISELKEIENILEIQNNKTKH